MYRIRANGYDPNTLVYAFLDPPDLHCRPPDQLMPQDRLTIEASTDLSTFSPLIHEMHAGNETDCLCPGPPHPSACPHPQPTPSAADAVLALEKIADEMEVLDDLA